MTKELTPALERPVTPPKPVVQVVPPSQVEPAAAAAVASFEAMMVKGQEANLSLLFTILSYRRAHGSDGEVAFLNEVLIPYINETKLEAVAYGPNSKPEEANLIVDVPHPDGTASDTMFSCHIDTVHSTGDKQIRQKLNIDPHMEHVFLGKGETGCLGADNGAGVWLLMEMIRFQVPGTYVFHRGEERGCIGSYWLAGNYKDWAKKFKRSIAFDRKDTNEVITHQRGSRTASDKFAMELATQLSKHNLTYKPSANGVYTDTASYKSIIPECTNIGVGYADAHGASENQDYCHVQELLIACVAIEWDKLPTDRDPAYVAPVATPPYSGRGYEGRGYGYGGSSYGLYDDYDDADLKSPARGSDAKWNSSTPAQAAKPAAGSSKAARSTVSPLKKAAETSIFEGLGYGDIMYLLEAEDGVTIASEIVNLIEEIEGLKARLEYRKSVFPDAY